MTMWRRQGMRQADAQTTVLLAGPALILSGFRGLPQGLLSLLTAGPVRPGGIREKVHAVLP